MCASTRAFIERCGALSPQIVAGIKADEPFYSYRTFIKHCLRFSIPFQWLEISVNDISSQTLLSLSVIKIAVSHGVEKNPNSVDALDALLFPMKLAVQ